MRNLRHNRILELIKQYEVETQDQLQALLQDSGYDVTQATISRDIKDLQLVKSQGKNGKYKYVSNQFSDRPISERFIKIFRETLISYAAANNLIVVKTLPGCGNAAGEAVDCLGLDHIIGSVCGDNTMLIVVDSNENVAGVLEEFDRLLNKAE